MKTLKDRREAMGLATHGFAYESGLAVNTVSAIEKGEHVGTRSLQKYADTLGVSLLAVLRIWVAMHETGAKAAR